MSDLISRKAALDAIDKNRQALLSLGMDGAEHILVHYGRRVIEELPTIDIIGIIEENIITDIVRCRDCRYFAIVNQPYDQTWCGVMQDSVKPDGYCYWGERRDDDSD